MKLEKRIKVISKQGLHARPAAMFVEVANRFVSRIKVAKGELVVDGKSILNILMLGVECSEEIVLQIEGEDAQEAMGVLEDIITRKDV
ncbi:MAG: HPr family phosphocarrier protein [Candidatus Saelkia tenebricola]|nr:HPr family phosphocarrier protein [Candidatus Saelkia tenebricola]